MYNRIIKRSIDFLFSFIFLFCFSPLYLLVILMIVIANRSFDVIFSQKRPGKNEDSFIVYKFKSMNDERDKTGRLLPDADRLTVIGRFIRATSLDELPQMINVLKGEMSLIGPRPLLSEYLPYYTVRERKRHSVRPGITGYTQVNGRNNLSWDERLEMDVYYVENISIWLDMIIFFKTISNVVSRKDVQVITGDQKTSKLSQQRCNQND